MSNFTAGKRLMRAMILAVCRRAVLAWMLAQVLLLLFAAIVLGTLLKSMSHAIQILTGLSERWAPRASVALVFVLLPAVIYMFGTQLLHDLERLSQTLPEKAGRSGKWRRDLSGKLLDVPVGDQSRWLVANLPDYVSGTVELFLAGIAPKMGEERFTMSSPSGSSDSGASTLASYQTGIRCENIAPRPLPPNRRRDPWTVSLWGKGGAAKTTTCLQLAGIAVFLGHKALVLDVDPQGSAAAWRSLRDDDTIAVQSGRPGEVDELLRRARRAAFDLVLIDNAPARNADVSRIAGLSDLSILLARPSAFDLVVARKWIQVFAGRKYFTVISAAPPVRQSVESPLVRDARRAMSSVGGRVWKGQLTARHAVVQSIGLGQTLIEADPSGPATLEYCRLWNLIIKDLLGTIG
jgi:chromosome partitioning protein